MKIIIRLMDFARKYWGWLLLAFLGLLVSTAFSLAVPWVLREAIDNIISRGERSFLILAAIAIVIFSILRGLSAYTHNYFAEVASQRTVYESPK